MSGELSAMSPGTWSIDVEAGELYLTIAWFGDWEEQHFEQYVEKGRIKQFDMDTRTLTYDVSKTPENLDVFGLNHLPCK